MDQAMPLMACLKAHQNFNMTGKPKRYSVTQLRISSFAPVTSHHSPPAVFYHLFFPACELCHWLRYALLGILTSHIYWMSLIRHQSLILHSYLMLWYLLFYKNITPVLMWLKISNFPLCSTKSESCNERKNTSDGPLGPQNVSS